MQQAGDASRVLRGHRGAVFASDITLHINQEGTVMVKTDRSILKGQEPHPAYPSALEYLSKLGYEKLMIYQEAFASTAIKGNRLAEVCAETLDRMLLGWEPISDRYLLGLAWTIRNTEEKRHGTD